MLLIQVVVFGSFGLSTKEPCTMTNPGFEISHWGAPTRRGAPETYAKTKELGPVVGGHAGGAP